MWRKFAVTFPCSRGEKEGGGIPLAYLDNGATTLKPQAVISAISDYYGRYSSNVHRGLYPIAQEATDRYEKSREIVAQWIHAPGPDQIVFTSGTTASMNLLAYCYGSLLQEGDEIIVSVQDHHSNIVPWQLLQQRKRVALKVLPINDRGELELEQLSDLLSKKTKIVSLPHISNTLGTINPIAEIVAMVKKSSDAIVAVDGAQALARSKVDVQQLDVDFYCFSAHKVFGPTGTGVLYGKQQWLEKMPPFMGGGDMVDEVDFAGTTFAPPPQKFEAGTPNIAGAIGLGAALSYLKTVGIESIAAYEKELTLYALKQLKGINGLTLLGEAALRTAIFAFVLEGAHPQDLATILGQKGIAVRTGHHCTWPLLKRYRVESSTRASLAMYNTKDEIDRLVQAIGEAVEILS